MAAKTTTATPSAAENNHNGDIRLLPIAEIARDVYQPRRQDNAGFDALVASLRIYGQRAPIIVSEKIDAEKLGKGRRYVITGGGNTRHKAMEQLGEKEIRCIVIPHPGIVKSLLGSIDENCTRTDLSFGDIAHSIGVTFDAFAEGHRAAGGNDSDARGAFVKHALENLSMQKTTLYLGLSTYENFGGEVPQNLTKAIASQLSTAMARARAIMTALLGDSDLVRAPLFFEEEKGGAPVRLVYSGYQLMCRFLENTGFKKRFNALVDESFPDAGGEVNSYGDTLKSHLLSNFVRDLFRGIMSNDFKKDDYSDKKVAAEMKKSAKNWRASTKSGQNAARAEARAAAPNGAGEKKAQTTVFQSIDLIPRDERTGLSGNGRKFSGDVMRLFAECREDDSMQGEEGAKAEYMSRLGEWCGALPGLFRGHKKSNMRGFDDAVRWARLMAAAHDDRIWNALFEKTSTPVEFGDWLMKSLTGCEIRHGGKDALIALCLLAGNPLPTDYRSANECNHPYPWAALARFSVLLCIRGRSDCKYEIALRPLVRAGEVLWMSGWSGGGHYASDFYRMATADKGRAADDPHLAATPREAVINLFVKGASVRFDKDDYTRADVKVSVKTVPELEDVIDDLNGGKLGAVSDELAAMERQFIKWKRKAK